MTVGFANAGFEPVAAVEWDLQAAATYAANFGEDHVHWGDITHWKKLPYALLIGVLLLFGCYPKLLTGKINTAYKSIQQAVQSNFSR